MVRPGVCVGVDVGIGEKVGVSVGLAGTAVAVAGIGICVSVGANPNCPASEVALRLAIRKAVGVRGTGVDFGETAVILGRIGVANDGASVTVGSATTQPPISVSTTITGAMALRHAQII
jgi:hypothetical protein